MLRNRLLLDITRPSLVKMNFIPTPCNLSIRPTLGVGGEEISNDWAGEWEYSLPRGRSKGFEEGQGAATRDEPPRGRLVGIENQYWDRKAFCFRFALILFSSLFISHRNTEYSGYSPFLQLKMLSQRVVTGTSETIAARLPAGADINRPLTPHWWV